MRYHEIIEATKDDREPENDRQNRAEDWHKLDTARHKRSRAAQIYQDRTKAADDELRTAQQALAETDTEADEPDYHTEHQRWQRYWAKQKRWDRALAADAEQRSRGLSANASMCLSAPTCDWAAG